MHHTGRFKCWPPEPDHDEAGFALILTVFIVALATILVLDFASETLAYQSNARASTERVQADFTLKSTLNVAKLLLELPKLPTVGSNGELRATREDWLGETWAFASSLPSLPFPGDPRLTIVDESGKININAIYAQNPFGGLNPNPTPTPPGAQDGDGGQQQQPQDPTDFWKNALSDLFERRGFQREVYRPEARRTLGDTGYDANDQVAVLHDWIDPDSDSHSSGTFPGEGIESFAEKTWFYNRPLRSMSELALVPGMTLERIQAIGPFVKTSRTGFGTAAKINVNTAPIDVLLALGFEEATVVRIEEQRAKGPIANEDLRDLVAGSLSQLPQAVGVTSQEFSAYAQVRGANSTRWAKALISIQGGQQRRAVITSLEVH